MKHKLIIFLITSVNVINSLACTAFGFINESGTVIAKNRDYTYDSQQVKILKPNKQFFGWMDNNYNNRLKIFALLSNDDLKMGVNQKGLTAIEEDPMFPKNADYQRQYIQPIDGYSEGMVLWGVLQNFASVEQIIPYIDSIFAYAAPNYYQFADSKKILTIEVAYGANQHSPLRDFSYKILDKKSQQFTHTNFYQNPKYQNLNQVLGTEDALNGAIARNMRISWLINNNEKQMAQWLFDTNSRPVDKSKKDKNWCQNTSIFRSDLQGESMVSTIGAPNNKLSGTVSHLIVENYGSDSKVSLMLIDKIINLKDGNQEIFYRELKQNLSNLFSTPITFTAKIMLRKAPVNGICS